MNEAPLKVGEVAEQAGVGVQTLHYYERLGLLPKPGRSAANYRLYTPEAVRRVRFVKKAQALGLNLQEIKEVLELKDRRKALVGEWPRWPRSGLWRSIGRLQSCGRFGVSWRRCYRNGGKKPLRSESVRVSFAT